MSELADTAAKPASVMTRRGEHAAAPGCRTAILNADQLRALPAPAWDALSGRALEDNPWLSRQMVLAGLDAYGDAHGVRALSLYDRSGDTLIGLLPYKVLGVGPVGLGAPALNLYQVGGTPLIARDHADTAMSALMQAIARDPGMPGHWLFPHVPTEGAFARAAMRCAKDCGVATAITAPYHRPVLTRQAGDFSGHIAQVIGKKRAKDIERNLRRLGKEGAVSFERSADPESVATRVEDFLRIEAAGWKGERGTAFLSSPKDAAFARRAFGGQGAALGLASVDSLLVGGEPIAVSINIATGETLFTPKCAFDERYRKFGPGMMLEYKVIETFFAKAHHAEMDAATTVEGHVISGLWGQTKPMGTLVVGRNGPTTRALAGTMTAVKKGRQHLKQRIQALAS